MMITPDYAAFMARYNRWQNRAMVSAANTLDDTTRKADHGLFFRSLHNTCIHILWADQLWLGRFTQSDCLTLPSFDPKVDVYPVEWSDYTDQREATDQAIIDWATTLPQTDIDQTLDWHSRFLNRTMTQPMAQLITHMFNHQTHHRGQVHSVLTAAGISTNDTDIPFMPPEELL